VLVDEGDLRGRRLLEIGCGTGQLSAALAERAAARVWAVDPEPRMLDVARTRVPRSVGLREGRAEQLPFRDGWFERAVMRLVLHLVDRPSALAEARRVLAPAGRLVVATFDPSHFDAYWLNRMFPSFESIDRERFATAEELERELATAGFAEVRLVRLSQVDRLTREQALEKVRGRHISTFDLLEEDEYRAGLARAERELPERVEVALEWLVAVAAV
jgi:ubiquinone/menaquinone biosynthesis C-methylase UbiE